MPDALLRALGLDEALVERLKAWRLDTAREEREKRKEEAKTKPEFQRYEAVLAREADARKALEEACARAEGIKRELAEQDPRRRLELRPTGGVRREGRRRPGRGGARFLATPRPGPRPAQCTLHGSGGRGDTDLISER